LVNKRYVLLSVAALIAAVLVAGVVFMHAGALNTPPPPPTIEDVIGIVVWLIIAVVVVMIAIYVAKHVIPTPSTAQSTTRSSEVEEVMRELLQEIRLLRREIEELRKGAARVEPPSPGAGPRVFPILPPEPVLLALSAVGTRCLRGMCGRGSLRSSAR